MTRSNGRLLSMTILQYFDRVFNAFSKKFPYRDFIEFLKSNFVSSSLSIFLSSLFFEFFIKIFLSCLLIPFDICNVSNHSAFVCFERLCR